MKVFDGVGLEKLNATTNANLGRKVKILIQSKFAEK